MASLNCITNSYPLHCLGDPRHEPGLERCIDGPSLLATVRIWLGAGYAGIDAANEDALGLALADRLRRDLRNDCRDPDRRDPLALGVEDTLDCGAPAHTLDRDAVARRCDVRLGVTIGLPRGLVRLDATGLEGH